MFPSIVADQGDDLHATAQGGNAQAIPSDWPSLLAVFMRIPVTDAFVTTVDPIVRRGRRPLAVSHARRPSRREWCQAASFSVINK